MPYISETERNNIHEDLCYEGIAFTPENAGELNYLVSEMINNYLRKKGVRYANINEMIGALECCKLELYRVIAAPYEDEKADENGEVYTALDDEDSDGY